MPRWPLTVPACRNTLTCILAQSVRVLAAPRRSCFCSCSCFCSSPRLVPPRLASPHLASPHLTAPHLTSPHRASPRLASSRRASPHLTSPHRRAAPRPVPTVFTSLHLASPSYSSFYLTSPSFAWLQPRQRSQDAYASSPVNFSPARKPRFPSNEIPLRPVNPESYANLTNYIRGIRILKGPVFESHRVNLANFNRSFAQRYTRSFCAALQTQTQKIP